MNGLMQNLIMFGRLHLDKWKERTTAIGREPTNLGTGRENNSGMEGYSTTRLDKLWD